jgi:proteasome activator subunit 4
MVHNFLGISEREDFVRSMLKTIEHDQYSKHESLVRTVVIASSMLSYVEPTIALPFMVSSFHIGLDDMTGPHQFKSTIIGMVLFSCALLLVFA